MITAARLRLHPRAPAEDRRRLGLRRLRRRARRLPPHPPPRRHAGRAPPLRPGRVGSGTSSVDDDCVLVVLDEGDEGLSTPRMAVVDAECAAARPPARRRSSSSAGWRTATTSPPSPRSAGPASSSTPSRSPARWSALPALYDDVRRGARRRSRAPSSPRPTSRTPTPTAPASTSPSPAAGPDGDGGRRRGAGVGRDLLPSGLGRGDGRRSSAHGGAISHHHGIGLNRAGSWPRRSATGFGVLAAAQGRPRPAADPQPGQARPALPLRRGRLAVSAVDCGREPT